MTVVLWTYRGIETIVQVQYSSQTPAVRDHSTSVNVLDKTMKTIINFLQKCGLWSRDDIIYSPRRVKFCVTLIVVFLLFPCLGFVCRHSHNFRMVIKASLELVIIIRCVFLFSFTLYYRPVMEQVYSEIRDALTSVSLDSHDDIQITIQHLESSSELLIKGYMYSDMVSVVLYCLLPPLVSVVKYTAGSKPILVTVYTSE